jgi:uncharacterized protein (TIGR03435 family)
MNKLCHQGHHRIRRAGARKRLTLSCVLFAAGFVSVTAFQAKAEGDQSAGPSFEAISIRPARTEGTSLNVRMMFEGDGYRATNVTLIGLVKAAYGMGLDRIEGLPTWSTTERYNIDARIDGNLYSQLVTLDPKQLENARRKMLQAMLVDRFGLKVHYEPRELPVFSLIPAKSGPKLKESTPDEVYPGMPEGFMQVFFLEGRITGKGVAIDLLVQRLSSEMGHVVVDKTGLTGRYDFTLQCAPGEIRALSDGDGSANIPETEESGPSLLSALEEQLGLKLISQKGQVEVLIIDKVDKPTEN